MVPDSHEMRQKITSYMMHPTVGTVAWQKQNISCSGAAILVAGRKNVQNHIHKYESCQHNKGTNPLPAGSPQPLPIPEWPWDSVSVDFIVQLPKTKAGYDAILVFVDRLTKMMHLAPCKITVDSEGTATLFVDNVWKHHGIPKDIVTYRDSVYVGKFLSEVLRLIGTQHKRTTAYHPQSDGKTERVNGSLKI